MGICDLKGSQVKTSGAGLFCQPRFDVLNHGQKAAILKIWDRNYCRECLLERIENNPPFAAEVIVYLLLNR